MRLTLKMVNELLRQQKGSWIEPALGSVDLQFGKYWIKPSCQEDENGDPIAYNTLADLVKGEGIQL